MDLAVGGNFICCLIIVAIFIGIGRADRLVGYFEVIIGGGGASHKEMGPFLWGNLSPQDNMQGF